MWFYDITHHMIEFKKISKNCREFSKKIYYFKNTFNFCWIIEVVNFLFWEISFINFLNNKTPTTVTR